MNGRLFRNARQGSYIGGRHKNKSEHNRISYSQLWILNLIFGRAEYSKEWNGDCEERL